MPKNRKARFIPPSQNKFTSIVRDRGWTVKDACIYWDIRLATYSARVNNPDKHNELECMCEGLPRRMQTEPLIDEPTETSEKNTKTNAKESQKDKK